MTWKPWLLPVGITVALAVLAAPMFLGHRLRSSAAKKLEKQNLPAHLKVLPLLSKASASLPAHSPKTKRLLDKSWPALERFKGSHVELLWLELARQNAAAGRNGHARAAIARARQADPQVERWVRGPEFEPYLKALRLNNP